MFRQSSEIVLVQLRKINIRTAHRILHLAPPPKKSTSTVIFEWF